MNTRSLLLVATALFLAMAGFGIIIPALPYYTAQLQGDETTVGLTVGLLMASYSLTQLVCAPAWGHLSDRVGRRPVLLVGLVGYIVSFSLMGLAPSLPWLFAGRILGGVLTAAMLPSALAMVGDLTSADDRGKGMGIAGAAMGLGFVFGPAIGGLLARGNDFRLPFFVAAGAAAVTLGMAAITIRESLPETGPVVRPQLSLRRGLEQEGAHLWPWFTLTFAQTCVFSALEATLALYSRDAFHLSTREVGFMLAIMGFVSALFSGGAVGRLIKRFGEAPVVKLGFVLFAVGFFAAACASSAGLLTAFLVVIGVGLACMRPSLSAGVSKGAVSGQGTALGLMQSVDSLARVAGPLLGGGLYIFGRGLPFAAEGTLSVAALVFAMIMLHPPVSAGEASAA